MSELTHEDLKQLKTDIREFFALSIENVLKEVSRLAGLLERADQALRNIELNTNTRIATMQKDIDNLYDEMDSVRKFNSVEKEEGARQAADLSLQSSISGVKNDLNAFKEIQDKRWMEQTEINAGVRTITKLLWMILGIVSTIGLGFIWQLLTRGGLAGMTP